MGFFLCFTLWCLAGHAPEDQVNRPPIHLTLATDVYSTNEYVERFVLVEQYRVFGGLVASPATLVAVAGYFPLRFTAYRFTFDGGGSWATGELPTRGTTINWTARVRARLQEHVALDWWHFSNARSAVPNPSLDALGLTFTW